MTKALLLLAGALCLTAADAPKRTFDGPFRLEYHFTPPRNWTNDPNGLVYYKGEYHLFYQYNPFGTKWGHMSWGHAVSPDLLHWRDLPVALQEEDGVMVFSGSAVVDEHNSSGLCRNRDSSDRSCLVAIYTGHTATRQTQNIASSNDRGRTWMKYKGNPVLDLGLKDFRDPKVMWYAPQKKWVMTAALSDRQKLRFFESRDLIHWKALSDFGPAGATGGAWECPDLFELPVTGTAEKRWVLVVNINPGGVAGGSGTQYFIGRFDGTRFTNENAASQQLWMDYGKDHYAAISYFGVPDSRRVMTGWFSNWQYANDTPETDWRGAMNLPREISLVKTPSGIRVRQQPVRELKSLRLPSAIQSGPVGVSAANSLLEKGTAGAKAVEMEIAFDPASAHRFGVAVFKGDHEQTLVGVDRDRSSVFVDRRNSGLVDFNKHFSCRSDGPIHIGEIVTLHIFLDKSSVEVFANDGETTVSDRVYPKAASAGSTIFSDGGDVRVRSLKVWRLESVWNRRAAAR
jgi:sucrose-6-phosphate hydrolase SacC (GH32 family)